MRTRIADRFAEIYAKVSWGNAISSIVDVGCGDWQFSRFLNLTGARYTGFDVVKSLIDRNNRNFGRPGVEFAPMPADPSKLPPADLLIMKDVLQHLPDEHIFRFRDHVFGRYRFALLTNSYEKIDSHLNIDIAHAGEFRCLDLSAAPYTVVGAYVHEYWAQPWERIRTNLVN